MSRNVVWISVGEFVFLPDLICLISVLFVEEIVEVRRGFCLIGSNLEELLSGRKSVELIILMKKKMFCRENRDLFI